VQNKWKKFGGEKIRIVGTEKIADEFPSNAETDVKRSVSVPVL
jgi:hypothetical protein